ncbi:co-chaperone GroES [bacterium]|jgi:chaperonin GroES|nr:co-chaperone GroES [bacterium]
MEIRPLHDRVIVRRVEEKKTTSSGLIIPDSSTEKPSRGEVVATGNGKVSAQGDLIPLDVKVGDTVMFGQYSGSEITVGEEKLLVMSEDEIVAVIEE